ncbi:type II toxin-antitoxin system HipA family toxin [Qipengyuania sp. ASV99]|uniref:type II toxin-antitoxin system HipA family toxin n=1 Tax=Qipengyuania sp. ASV99 TaxID=3399681 RepID=UPI003A4C77D0
MKLAPGTPLEVLLWTDETAAPQPVGRLAMAGGVAQLEWSEWARAARLAFSPLHYPPEPGLHAARRGLFDGLHGFLADSLPDAWGALLLHGQLRRLGHRYDDLDAVDRLALIGNKGRGALVFRPATLVAEDAGAIDLDRLAGEAHHVLLGHESELDAFLARLGGGSGGARPKVHISIDADGLLQAGDELANSAAGLVAEQWIVKFPSLSDPPDIGPIEEAYARMARAAGIEMAETRLIASQNGSGHFATRRFDRPAPGKRIHMVSLGGAVEASPHMPSLDYDGFFRATLAITRDVRDLEQAFRRMVFNVLAHNRDDHVRQHAFLMDTKGEWHLSPAFDLTFSRGPGGEHYMGVEGEGRAITRAHVDALGQRHGIAPRRIAEMVEQVRDALAEWPAHARETGVDASCDEINVVLTKQWRQFAL